MTDRRRDNHHYGRVFRPATRPDDQARPDDVAHESESIVERMGFAWHTIGWVLFAGWFLGPYFTTGEITAVVAVRMGFGIPLLLWWIVDVIDQQAAVWQILVGVVMIGIGQLPRGGLLMVAAWIIYWTRVRE